MSVPRLRSGRALGRNAESYNPHKVWLASVLDRSRFRMKAGATPATVPLDMSASPIVIAYPWIMGGMFLNGPDPQAVSVLMAVFGLSQAQAEAIAAVGLGDCFWAAATRRAAIAAASVGKLLWTTYSDALKACLLGYASTGWLATNSAATDNGTDPTQGFSYLSTTGLWLSAGTSDKQSVQIAVNPADFEELTIAFNLSAGNLSFGINFPSNYDTATTWDVSNSPIAGQHEIAAFSNLNVKPNGIEIDSWGERIVFTAGGIAQNCVQCTAVLDLDSLGAGGANVQGLDFQQIQDALQAQPT